MDFPELGLTAVRAFAVYVVMLIVIRSLGKRTVGNFAAFDLLVALMLGEVVDEIIYADVTFLQGTVAIVVIAGAHAGNGWLSWWGHGFDKLTEGTPTVIVRDGALQRDGMRAERMNVRDVMAQMRVQGIQDIREVKVALVEDDGSISVLRHEWAEPARRSEVSHEAAVKRRADIQGRDEPASDERTDAPQWLD